MCSTILRVCLHDIKSSAVVVGAADLMDRVQQLLGRAHLSVYIVKLHQIQQLTSLCHKTWQQLIRPNFWSDNPIQFFFSWGGGLTLVSGQYCVFLCCSARLLWACCALYFVLMEPQQLLFPATTHPHLLICKKMLLVLLEKNPLLTCDTQYSLLKHSNKSFHELSIPSSCVLKLLARLFHKAPTCLEYLVEYLVFFYYFPINIEEFFWFLLIHVKQLSPAAGTNK